MYICIKTSPSNAPCARLPYKINVEITSDWETRNPGLGQPPAPLKSALRPRLLHSLLG